MAANHIKDGQKHAIFWDLAEQYMTNARCLQWSSRNVGVDRLHYYKLLAMAVTCLEAVLHQQCTSEIEIRTRLRHATILFKHTSNRHEAEQSVNRAIQVAKRDGLVDLMFAAQLLLVKILHASSPKAAHALLVTSAASARQSGYVQWLYSFQLLHLEIGKGNSIRGTLRAMSQFSSSRGDSYVFALAKLLEAMHHLGRGEEGSDQALQALSEFDESIDSSQLQLLHCILKALHATTLHNMALAIERMKILHQLVDESGGRRNTLHTWKTDGSFKLALNTNGSQGSHMLCIKWANGAMATALTYLVSGLARLQTLDSKSSKFFAQGLRMIDAILTSDKPPPGLMEGDLHRLYDYLLLYAALGCTMRHDLEKSGSLLSQVANASHCRTFQRAVDLLTTTSRHIMEPNEATIKAYDSIAKQSDEFGKLAFLNQSLLVNEQASLLSLDSNIEANKLLLVACEMLAAIQSIDGEMITRRKALATTVSVSTESGNSQLQMIALGFLATQWVGVENEQASKIATASYLLATKQNDHAWALACGGLLVDVYREMGKSAMASKQEILNEQHATGSNFPNL